MMAMMVNGLCNSSKERLTFKKAPTEVISIEGGGTTILEPTLCNAFHHFVIATIISNKATLEPHLYLQQWCLLSP